MDVATMLKRVEDHYRSFWQGDLDDLDHQLSPEFVDEAAPPGTPPGIAAVKAAAAGGRGSFPDMTVTVDDHVAGGNIIAVRARWRGTNTGPLMGRPATGKTIEFAGMVMWRFDADGRIDRRWTQIDIAAAFRPLFS